MTRRTTTRRATTALSQPGRFEDLKRMLETRQHELSAAVRGRIRDAREDGADSDHHVRDEAESSQVDVQTELDFALIELKTETLARITAALSKIDSGTYGRCVDCGDDISESRLRALPFAPRCVDCEGTHERSHRAAQFAVRSGRATLGFAPDELSRLR